MCFQIGAHNHVSRFLFNTVFLLADALKNAITSFIIPTVFLTAWTL
ncbi:unnamed protein product [Acanthoscelides obtectus]|uniref:Uncharacterized protein n=1 Tax=Acanthoscelides obtectus TaxID=200917 RepID=A0A9P0KEH4_ACAOB|nr:unnamed protein product [Acanthoscelides obtectus]CAK1633440.1 hypothetical protein AOBTE_LOCUS8135 [Acanthoscelides obtectus]